MSAEVHASETSVFPRLLDLPYPNVDRGDGVRLYTTAGREILDACSGGAMVAALGHGLEPIVDAAYEQGMRIPYVYDHHFTNDRKEELADRLLTLAAPEMARVRFTSGGSEANETALRLARAYHADRGDSGRWRIISPAQAYHGATFGALALTGRPTLQGAYVGYLSPHLHLPPATVGRDPTGERTLGELDRLLDEAGPETIAAVFCEPVTGAALPAYSPPEAFWRGLDERRERHGFLVVFDEIVTGVGRTGAWFAGQELPIEPDIVTAGKALGAGYAPLAATMCRAHVYEAIEGGSRLFDLGHTWDGAPLPCAVGLAVLDYMEEHGLVARVREHGPRLRERLATALDGCEIAGEVRGRGFLLGVSLVDPRDGESFLPDELDAAALVDQVALEHGVLITSTHSNRDGYAGDEVLIAPAYNASDADLDAMVERFAAALSTVERTVKKRVEVRA